MLIYINNLYLKNFSFFDSLKRFLKFLLKVFNFFKEIYASSFYFRFILFRPSKITTRQKTGDYGRQIDYELYIIITFIFHLIFLYFFIYFLITCVFWPEPELYPGCKKDFELFCQNLDAGIYDSEQAYRDHLWKKKLNNFTIEYN